MALLSIARASRGSRSVAIAIVTAASLAAGASFAASATVARAQDAQPSASDMALARELFNRGVAAVDENRWPDAYEAFSRAYALVPRPLLLLNLAGAQARTGRLVASAESYRRFLREASSAEETRMRSAADQALRQLEPRIPRIRVLAEGLVEGDALTLDGQPFPTTAVGIGYPVDPGTHTLRVMRDGREVATASRVVAEGASLDVAIRAPAPPPLPRETWRPQPTRPPVLPPSGPTTRDRTRDRSRDRDRDRDDGGSVLASPWFWIATVVVVGGGVTAGVLVATSGDEAPPAAEPPTPFSGTLPPGRYELR